MTRRIKLRTLLMGGVMTLLFVGLIVRVYWVQVVDADFWSEQARKTWQTTKVLPQQRGEIVDRNGVVLADEAAAYTVAVSPSKIRSLEEENPGWRVADRIVSKLHNVLGKPEADLREMVTRRNKDGQYLQQVEVRNEGWKVDKEIYDRLNRFREELRELTGKKDVGLSFIEEKKRYYPNNMLAAHLLGYENKEGKAVNGLELAFDDRLSGTPGKITYQKDGIRMQLPDGEVEVVEAVDGQDLTLTIDRDIQFYIEEALREVYEQYKPVSATAIAADPKTMDILGMASYPSFDPNHYWETKDQEAFRNNAIQSLYEPGSTFKIVTLAAAVEEGIFQPDEKYESGKIKVTGGTIHDHKRSGWGEITYLEGLKRSSNVAFVKLGYEGLGADKLLGYIDAFGFGQKTGIELPSEVPGRISVRKNIPTEVATAAFGQGRVQVTPIQQVAAVAAVANGGKLMQPHLVQSIRDPNTGEKTVFEPKVVREVISPRTSRLVGEYLEQVVSDQAIGTGKNAFIPGYRIAGKTGTAQKVIDGKYSEDKFVVSFIGYAPVEDPRIVLYVVVDEPQVDDAGGGSIAAPVFRKIMEQSLPRLGVQPDRSDDATADATANAKGTKSAQKSGGGSAGPVTAPVPDVTGLTPADAKSGLKAAGFQAEVVGTGTKVLRQLPEAGGMLPTSQRVFLLTDAGSGAVPELKGLSLRDALEMCSLLEAVCTVDGEGYVGWQIAAKSSGVWHIELHLSPPGGRRAANGEGESGENNPGEGEADEGGSADPDGKTDGNAGTAGGGATA